MMVETRNHRLSGCFYFFPFAEIKLLRYMAPILGAKIKNNYEEAIHEKLYYLVDFLIFANIRRL